MSDDLPQEELRRRVRAARGYADLSIDQLAEAVGIGRNTIIRIDNGEREVKQMELRQIAAVCGLPYEFFTVDFAEIPELYAALERDEHMAARAALARLTDIWGDSLADVDFLVVVKEMRDQLVRIAAAVGAEGEIEESDAPAPRLRFDPSHPPDDEAPAEGSGRAR